MTPLTFPTENLTPPREVSGSLAAQKGRMLLARLPPNQALPARDPEAPASGSGSCIPRCPARNLAVTSDASLWSTPVPIHADYHRPAPLSVFMPPLPPGITTLCPGDHQTVLFGPPILYLHLPTHSPLRIFLEPLTLSLLP